jgi:hypothetical protein
MSVGSLGVVAYSVAGSSLAQTTGSDVVRARQDALVQQRSLEATQQTEDAQGIGKTDGDDNQTNERDGDGRTPWMIGRRHEETDEGPAEQAMAEEALEETIAAETDNGCGGQLDLSG